MTKMTWTEFSGLYCKTQACEPDELADKLTQQKEKYAPQGFFIAEAQLFDSTWFGQHVILPYGPNNTFRAVPTTPFSPRGLASDTSVAVGFIAAGDVLAVAGSRTDARR